MPTNQKEKTLVQSPVCFTGQEGGGKEVADVSAPVTSNDLLAVSIETAARMLSIGRGTAYEMVRTGQLPTLRIGLRRRVVPVAALRKLCNEAAGLES